MTARQHAQPYLSAFGTVDVGADGLLGIAKPDLPIDNTLFRVKLVQRLTAVARERLAVAHGLLETLEALWHSLA